MAMVSADDSSQSFGGLTAQIGWFGLRVGGHPALSLHSSNEPGELSQWLCHDDSTINIVVVIIIIIIINMLVLLLKLAVTCGTQCSVSGDIEVEWSFITREQPVDSIPR